MCIYHCINAWFIRWNCVICVTLRFSNFSVQLNPKWNKKHSHTHTNVRHTFSFLSMRFILAVLIKRTNSHPPYKYHLCTNICVCRNLSDIVSSVFLQFYTGGRWERAWVCVCVCVRMPARPTFVLNKLIEPIFLCLDKVNPDFVCHMNAVGNFPASLGLHFEGNEIFWDISQSHMWM